ncbi:ABC-2 type transport system permease protein [Bacillus pakistanensis]|uniref:ABC-2 type transport system permease protein n=2 Tax=Rossellomorea pakistanensis TaxID=992288 RepID=A0ABS2N7P2_9BACI|nr:ABC-2 type transport system permease protein [Bacillus pakistanensis]
MDLNTLWNRRFQSYIKIRVHYFSYMVNGGLLIGLLILLVTGIYYYIGWLKNLPETFPTNLLTSFVLSGFIACVQIRLFIKRADTLYLLPLERALEKSYFKKGRIFSFIRSFALLLIGVIIVLPLYSQNHEMTILSNILLIIGLSIVLGLNVSYSYVLRRKHSGFFTWLLMFVHSFVYSFIFVSSEMKYLIIGLLLSISLQLYSMRIYQTTAFPWEAFLKSQSRADLIFYSIANQFLDVKEYQKRVKRRAYLNAVLALFSNEATLYYLIRTFIRKGDSFGLFLRLTIIGVIVISFASLNEIWLFLFVGFIQFITGFQLIKYFYEAISQIPFHFLPVSSKYKQKAVGKLLSLLLFIQFGCFSISLMLFGENINPLAYILTLFTSVTLTVLFIHRKTI